MDFSRLTFILGLCVHNIYGISVEILKPNMTHEADAALVIVPAAKLTMFAYKPLAETMQRQSSFNLWVALLDGFFNSDPNTVQLPSAFRKAVSELQDAGYKGKKAFLAGHYAGGTASASYGHQTNSLLEGVLLFSSHLKSRDLLKDYPIPLLTLSGDLDGITRTTRIVEFFEELQKDLAENEDQKYITPVIVMEGINHAQFADGPMPSIVRENDLSPELSAAAAYETIANYSNAFMVSARNNSKLDLAGARDILDAGYDQTSAILQPLSELKALDQNEDMISHWTITAQQLIISLENTTSVEFINHAKEELKDRRTLSVFNSSEDVLKIKSRTNITFDYRSEDKTTGPLSPLQLKALMTSQEKVQEEFPEGGYGTPATCRDINEAAFTLAYSMSSTKAKTRYIVRGKAINFIDDRNTTSEITWERSDLGLNQNGTELFVSATRYLSYDRTKDGCTLLAPYRALEWIYIDSLKKQQNLKIKTRKNK